MLSDAVQSDPPLRILADRAWNLHREAEAAALPYLVRPSMPILYFGDSLGYFGSPLKVITVGLNPSRNEFPDVSPFSRFSSVDYSSGKGNLDIDSYLASLNNYFRTSPLIAWFDRSFEKLLAGMEASYYSGTRSVSLHTDFCTPLATDPTWSRLETSDHAQLEIGGRRLWHDLVEALQPDVVVVSIRRAYFDGIRFSATDQLRTIYTVYGKKDGYPRKEPYCVKALRRRLDSGKEPLFVFGRSRDIPFASVSFEERRKIGETILKVSQHG